MTDWPILSLLVFLPSAGALFVLVLRGESELVARNARYIALWTSVITFAFSLLLWTGFDTRDPGYQFEEQADWIAKGLGHPEQALRRAGARAHCLPLDMPRGSGFHPLAVV